MQNKNKQTKYKQDFFFPMQPNLCLDPNQWNFWGFKEKSIVRQTEEKKDRYQE